MASKISRALSRAQESNRAAFIPFVTGGFPDDQRCLALVKQLAAAGADVIEIGIPFSDPLADGPTIQASSQRALEAGATPAGVLRLAARAAGQVSAPLVIMTYYNPVLQMGADEFARRAAAAGVAGVIIPDLPPEEAGPWITAARAQDLDTIFMATLLTGDRRLRGILRDSRGFLYYVPLAGVTGSGLEIDTTMLKALGQVRRTAGLPVAVGFGVATPEQAAALGRVADGVIVGSALVREMLEAGDPDQGLAAAVSLAQRVRAVLED